VPVSISSWNRGWLAESDATVDLRDNQRWRFPSPAITIGTHPRNQKEMKPMLPLILTALLCASNATPMAAETATVPEPHTTEQTLRSILVFSKTAGFRHSSIEPGQQALQAMGEAAHFRVKVTEDASVFTAEELKAHQVVVFLNTTQDVLEPQQETVFENWIRQGGGYVGIHAASDTEYQWSFYGKLVGAYFSGHPAVQEATIDVVYPKHPAMMHLPRKWTRTDEWYNFKKLPGEGVRILAWLDTDSYQGSSMPGKHPAAWCHTIDKGRSFYTVGGHTDQSFSEPLFLQHLHGAIWWAAGNRGAPPASPKKTPEESRETSPKKAPNQ